MAEATTTEKATAAVSEAASKAKTTVKRKTTTAKRKATTAKRKATTAAKKATSKKSAPDFAARAQEAGRKAFLASLGFYGKAFDQAQDQFNTAQDQLEERRKKANKLYSELVKRGEKVEKEAKDMLDDIELPKLELESLTDRKKLEAQLEKAKARFSELKESVSFKKVA